MYKRTSAAEVVYILKRLAKDKAARRAEMEKATKAGKGKGKAGNGSSSQGGTEAQATDDTVGEELAGDNFARLDALATVAKELQEEEEEREEGATAALEEVEEDAKTLVHHSRKRLRRLGSLKGVDGSASAGKDAEDPVRSPQLSPRSESGDLAPPAGDDGDNLSAPLRGGGGEVTQGEPLLEEHVCPAAQAEDVVMESSAAETAQKAAESTPAEEEASDPATTAAEEIETPARQTSQSEEPDVLEVVADIGRSAADEAAKVAATEGHDLTVRGTLGSLAVVEHSQESAPVEEVVIEAKIPLQNMGPLPCSGDATDAPPSSSNTLAVRRGGEAEDSAAITMDLSFIESMAVGLKEMQARHNQKWQELKERHESADKVDQKLKDKCLELREWHDKQFKALVRQQEILQMMREDVAAREGRLANHKASLDVREREISLREEDIEATLHAKDESLEALVQQRSKELEDKHEAALGTLAANHAARLKKLVDDLDATSSAKVELDQQVAKLNEDLAESAKKVELLPKELENAKRLWQDADDRLKNRVDMSNLWIMSLTDIAEHLGAQATAMGMDGPVYSASKREVPSVKLGIFFNELIDKLKVHEEGRAERFATESRRLARDALFMVLSNIACRHPELDLDDGFKKPPAGADIVAAKEKAAPCADKVLLV
nr:uncharacterized protein LOC120967188 [Aegilops tauschii subsp. strangulata]